MEIRDAHEGDTEAIVALASGEIDPAFVLRERTVRVALPDVGEDQEPSDSGDLAGFLAFDARQDVVSVTRVGGSPEAVSGLLEDVIEFAAFESLPVEATVPADGETAVALEARGFSVDGRGPRFEGRETKQYRLEP